jgi:hypothetical protein
VGADGKPVVIHADLNAAQNLQRRFWTRHSDAYRLTAIAIKHSECDYWYSDSEGARIRGALAAIIGGDGYARLHPSEDDDGFILEKVTKAQWKKVIGGKGVAGEEEGIDELEIELAEAIGEDEFERTGQRQTFFRDPSGLMLRADRWYEGKVFWGRVRRCAAQALGIVAAAY